MNRKDKIDMGNNKNPTVNEFGTKIWHNKNGKLHRTDGPAVEWAEGMKAWYVNGEKHRLDGPAYTEGGLKVWYVNGKRHRLDGPAVEDMVEGESWYEKGKKHRIDGPAVINKDGKEWWLDGKRHRLDGPAMELENGYKEWDLYGKELPEELYLKLTGDIKDLPCYIGLGWDKFISKRLQG